MTQWIAGLALTIVTGLVAACSVGPMPSASTTTANPAWQHYFKIAYNVEGEGDTRKISGYVVNDYGAPMRGVQLLVQGLDANDAVLTQRIVMVPGALPGFSRSYFEARRVPAAEKYRVTVWTFDRIESPSWP